MQHTVIKELFKGKSLERTLANVVLADIPIKGEEGLDIGGAGTASQYRFLNIPNSFTLTTLDLNEAISPDIVIDLEKDSIPLPDSSQDVIFCFNVLEHVYEQRHVLAESNHVLREGGKFIATIPFLVNYHPDPNDYWRVTEAGLGKILNESGYSSVKIVPVGDGPFTAGFSQVTSLVPSFGVALLYIFTHFLDWVLMKLKPKVYFPGRYPLAYVITAKK